MIFRPLCIDYHSRAQEIVALEAVSRRSALRMLLPNNNIENNASSNRTMEQRHCGDNGVDCLEKNVDSYDDGSDNNQQSGMEDEDVLRQANNNNNTGKAFAAWSFARWQKKKSGPLYSIVRFCSNPCWHDNNEVESDDDGALLTPGSRRSQPWDFVGDNVLLDDDEEEELSREGNNKQDSCKNEDEGGMMITPTYGREDTVGILIRIYHAILNKCLKQSSSSSSKEEEGGGGVENDGGQYLLLGPVAHLIGLVCATKVSVKNLRLLLVLMEDTDSSSSALTQQEQMKKRSQSNSNRSSSGEVVSNLARLHILRALRYAAEYSIQINGMLIDKPGPQTFFSFGNNQGEGGGAGDKRKRGLSSSFYMPHWPFKYDFGMACWFRAESFCAFADRGTTMTTNDDDDDENSRHHVILFCARTQNGAQIEVSFKPHSMESEQGGRGGQEPSSSSSSTAATLFVTVKDATNDSKLRKIRLVGCVLSTGVWYHVAVRLTRPRLSRFSLTPFASKDEVSIFLNGKLMLREHMKMPQFPDSNGSKGGMALGFGSFSSSGNNESTKVPIEISFFSNFDGQAGALYIFKDHVSEETINALYRETIASSDQSSFSHFGSFVDRWDTNHGKLSTLTKAVSTASMHSELSDVALPNYSMFTGEYTQKRTILFDLAEEDDVDLDHIPAGLTRERFGSKLLIVWDPCRVSNGTLIDPHIGAHITLEEHASVWSFESVRDTIESLGGMSRLLPLFGMLQHLVSEEDRKTSTSKGIVNDHTNLIIPSLIFLVASFIREHESNACELYRCGGINVIEKLLYDSKKQDIDEGACYRLGVSPIIAQYNASALLDLWQASRLNFALETTVFSRLIFNVPLLLGGLAKSSGISFHCLYLPILSEIAMMNGDKVRDCVETGELFDLVAEYSRSGNDVVSGMS